MIREPSDSQFVQDRLRQARESMSGYVELPDMIRAIANLIDAVDKLAEEAGIEPTTPGLEGRCSIRLSYSSDRPNSTKYGKTFEPSFIPEDREHPLFCRQCRTQVGRAVLGGRFVHADPTYDWLNGGHQPTPATDPFPEPKYQFTPAERYEMGN